MSEPSERDLELLRWLVKPFPPHLIDRVSKGGQGTNDVVPHHVVTQRLLEIVGAYRFTLVPGSQEHDDLPAIPPDPSARSGRARAGSPAIRNCLTGAVYRLEFEMEPGKLFVAEEYGDCGDAYNWAHNGERGKQIASDAIKRCGMRAGIALHAWAQKHYYLHESAYLRSLLASVGQQPVEAPPAVRAGDEGPAQPQEEASPATLDVTEARSRPAPPARRKVQDLALPDDGEPEQFDNEPAPELIPEPAPVKVSGGVVFTNGNTPEAVAQAVQNHLDPEREERIRVAAAHRATVMLEAQGGDLTPGEWRKAHADIEAELMSYFTDHHDEAQAAYGEAQTARQQPVPGHEQAPEEQAPDGWQIAHNLDEGSPQSTPVDAETGEVLSVQALADRYCEGNFFRVVNAIKKQHPAWKDHGVGWFARLTGPDLDQANTLAREYYASKPAAAGAASGERSHA